MNFSISIQVVADNAMMGALLDLHVPHIHIRPSSEEIKESAPPVTSSVVALLCDREVRGMSPTRP